MPAPLSSKPLGSLLSFVITESKLSRDLGPTSIKIQLAFSNYLETLKADLLEVYRAAFRVPLYSKSSAEVNEFLRYLPIHAAQSGFRLVVAIEVETEKTIGFSYGRTVTARLPWHELVKTPLRSAGFGEWLKDAYQIVEMAVIPAAQGQGVGSRLHDRLLESLSHFRAVLTTMSTDSAAYRLYLNKGWRVLLDELFISGFARSYRVMGLELPYSTAQAA
ncbi:MAG: GNAT family N-acetyltransferase [Anaerolineales bacterium]|nr:GNAT family N-acetyltransferase [Anaerolineales bacterium]